jgi:hypothetical protein
VNIDKNIADVQKDKDNVKSGIIFLKKESDMLKTKIKKFENSSIDLLKGIDSFAKKSLKK